MAWSGSSYPDGTKNLPDNRVEISDNFGYIETEMGDDHFWVDATANKNGHHKHTAMVTTGADIDTSVPADTDGVTFIKTLDTDKQVLHHNDGTTIRPLSWGTVWAYAIFDPSTATITSSSNISSITYSGTVFTANFVKDLPSNNYMVLGSTTNPANGSSSPIDILVRGLDDTYINVGSFEFFVSSGNSVQTQAQLVSAGVTRTHFMVVL